MLVESYPFQVRILPLLLPLLLGLVGLEDPISTVSSYFDHRLNFDQEFHEQINLLLQDVQAVKGLSNNIGQSGLDCRYLLTLSFRNYVLLQHSQLTLLLLTAAAVCSSDLLPLVQASELLMPLSAGWYQGTCIVCPLL
jgi:hypothetical protein